MSREERHITPQDIMPLEEYEAVRAEKKRQAIERKRLTRVAIGPNATGLFETWDSMWMQIQEMLRIEKGGSEQLADELAAYDPMVPNGSELIMTLFFEVEDPVRRDEFLRRIGNVEDHVYLQVGNARIAARPEGDVARTRARDNKASAVHFFHFDFSPQQIADWRSGHGQTMAVIDHPNYGHAALISPETREFLSRACF